MLDDQKLILPLEQLDGKAKSRKHQKSFESNTQVVLEFLQL